MFPSASKTTAFGVLAVLGRLERVNQSLGPFEIGGPQAASLHESESQTTSDAQSVTDRKKQMPASRRIQGHAGARLPSAGGPLVNGSRSEPVQRAMSRYVPRPSWSSSSGRTPGPSAPRPPARRIPHRPGSWRTKVSTSIVWRPRLREAAAITC
jgi:hypothetical protein